MCSSIGMPKTINFLFVPNGKLVDFYVSQYLSTLGFSVEKVYFDHLIIYSFVFCVPAVQDQF